MSNFSCFRVPGQNPSFIAGPSIPSVHRAGQRLSERRCNAKEARFLVPGRIRRGLLIGGTPPVAKSATSVGQLFRRSLRACTRTFDTCTHGARRESRKLIMPSDIGDKVGGYTCSASWLTRMLPSLHHLSYPMCRKCKVLKKGGLASLHAPFRCCGNRLFSEGHSLPRIL